MSSNHEYRVCAPLAMRNCFCCPACGREKGMVCLRELIRGLTAALLIAMLAGVGLHSANAEDNGLERTPVLGWSSWSFLRKLPTADKMKAQALALHNSGLQKIGYQYVNLDDFW